MSDDQDYMLNEGMGAAAKVVIEITKERDALKARIEALENRLELTGKNGLGEPVKTDIGECDGISCRDETIKLLDENEARLRAKLAKVEKERDALRKVELPKLTKEIIKRYGGWCVPVLYHRSIWADFPIKLIDLINKERGV